MNIKTPVQAFIRDKNRLWLFNITEEELNDLKQGSLQLFWSRITYDKLTNQRKGKGWCLVNKKQRELLLDPTDYDNQKSYFKLNTAEQQSWSSIRRLEDLTHEPQDTHCQHCFRNFRVIKRTPISSQRLEDLRESQRFKDVWQPFFDLQQRVLKGE